MQLNRGKLSSIWLLTLVTSILEVNCELYTSVETFSRWSDATHEISWVLEKAVEEFERILRRLNDVKHSIKTLSRGRPSSSSQQQEPARDSKAAANYERIMSNPVNAFVTINRLKQAVENIDEILAGDVGAQSSDSVAHMDYSEARSDWHSSLRKLKSELPIEVDRLGSGKALLRLQSFYDLDIRNLINGTIDNSDSSYDVPINQWEKPISDEAGFETVKMNALDCFELGKIAFGEDQFNLAIQWLVKALEMIYDENGDCDGCQQKQLINRILDYTAFAAYKLDMIEYSANLTRSWLERDPQNERARENLEYYLEMLEERGRGTQANELEHKQKEEGQAQDFDLSSMEIDEYSPTDDQVVRRLCRKSDAQVSSSARCMGGGFAKWHFFWPGLKLELLNEAPRIVRIHDIITEREADHFRRAALPLLERSTVRAGAALRTSEFRVAKTAWLSSAADELVSQVEQRLASVLDIDMQSAEHFQVVNYGLGGFYGPHLDSARSFRREEPSGRDGANSVPIGELQRNDRLATILIYLSHVEAGGATVFPRLNLTVAPVERSAVVWFNIQASGHSDERTLHTGCPVLLGSKWIATKWPREKANSFKRPCKQDKSSAEMFAA